MNAHKMMVWSMILVMLLSAAGSFASARGENEKVQTRGVILIHNVYDLQNMSKDLNASYELANDINATITKTWNGGAGFIPIGNKSAPFNGTFDGQGYKIVGLYINSSASYTGLFGYTTKNAVIKNISLINISISSSSNNAAVGGIVGNNNGIMQNCYVIGNISGHYAGGLVGWTEGIVNNSYYDVNAVLINGGNYLTTGGIYDSQFNDWLAHNLTLSIENYPSLVPAGETYEISNVQGIKDLLGFAEYGLKFKLTSNIDLSAYPDLYIPYFAGVFDGVNHTISNLSVNIPFDQSVGLFGINKGTIENLGVINVSTNGTSAGGLVGENMGYVNDSYATGGVNGIFAGGLIGTNMGNVRNSHATGSANGTIAGGFVGWNYGTISESYAIGNAGGYYVGGLVGANWKAISESHSVENASGYYAGGLVGTNRKTISKSYAVGNDSGTYSGGLVGDNIGGTVSESYATGNVNGYYSGGLVGENELDGVVNTSYAMGNVSASGDYSYAGGLVGYNNEGIVNNSYATGNVSGYYAGGLVGYNYYESVIDSYATGKVIGNYVGGLIGSRYYGIVKNCFWDINTSGIDHSAGGVGKTTEEMMNESTFLNATWDFNSTWGIWNENTYPFFRWQNMKSIASAPINLYARVGDGYVNLTWGIPKNDGHLTITEYRIYRNGTLLTSLPATAQLWYNDSGLINGANYSYYVTAMNAAGESPKSDVINAVPMTVPTAPQNLQVTVGNKYVNLTWQAPKNDGGSAITEYKIYRNSSLLATVSYYPQQWYNDTGVVNGANYSYYVTAMNAAGESPKSDVINAVPMTVPTAPQNLQVTVGNKYVNLTWQAPKNDGGSAITEYKIYRNGTPIATVSARCLWYNNTNLVNGINYTYYVTAINAVGESPKSNKVTAAPGVPMAPENLTSKVGNKYVNLTWNAPLSNGGFTITEYKIYRNGALLATVPATQLWYNDTNVSAGVTYTYYVTAVNAVGESPKSNEVQATPPASVPEMNMWLVGLLAIALLFLRRRK